MYNKEFKEYENKRQLNSKRSLYYGTFTFIGYIISILYYLTKDNKQDYIILTGFIFFMGYFISILSWLYNN
jgi:apolipoprotein N-acyltransferase